MRVTFHGRDTQVEPGQVWERDDGTRFTIDRVDGKYAWYWLQAGGHPQFRSIGLENLVSRYRRIVCE